MLWATMLLAFALSAVLLLRWGTRWGSTAAERARDMPGDAYLEGGPRSGVSMTRAISIDAPPERVWPWIAQLGRGAGWYSIDWLDNGRKTSARHIVSWIPEPKLGDAVGIGYLREIDLGRSLTWWLGDATFVGSKVRMVTCFQLLDEGPRTRVVSRISADGAGVLGPFALLVFRAIDSIMASRQLIGLRARIEAYESDDRASKELETGDRSQYQLYEVLYAGGGSAGVAGQEQGRSAREAAIRDGILKVPH